MNIRRLVKQALTGQMNKRYERIYLTKKVTYDQWILQEEKSSSVSRREWKEADKEPLFFYVFIGKEGELSENALEEISFYFMDHNEVSLLYADEDVRVSHGQQKRRSDPWFKPEWSPDTFLSFYYWGNITAFRGGLARQAGIMETLESSAENIKDSEEVEKENNPESAQQEIESNVGQNKRKNNKCNFVKRVILENMPWITIDIFNYPSWKLWKSISRKLVEVSGGFNRSCAGIGHIPRMLFHGDSLQAQEKFFSWTFEEDELLYQELGILCNEQDHSYSGKVQKKIGSEDIALSVIIPSKDHPVILEQAVHSLMDTAGDAAYEVIVVDNGSSQENQKKIEKLIQSLSNKLKITYLYEPMPFNFSKMCNSGAEKAKGKHLLFLNDDVEMKDPGWMEKMVEKSDSPYTGAVGLKLFYPESENIQHAGITNLPMGPVHKLQFSQDKESYYYGRNRFDSNVLAVTGACLMVQKEKFRQARGFPEELSVAFNDVDLCFSLYELGYQNVVINSFWAWHHESLSRGGDESCEKMERLQGERDKLYERHPGLGGEDPYYPRGLNRDGLDTSIRPGFPTSGNVTQPCQMKEMEAAAVSKYRQDQCLMVRVEYCGQDKIYGYGVVLGDNNACYRKSLLLGMAQSGVKEESQWAPLQLWSQEIWEQYRPDLEENMKDQCNVALSGFAVDLTQLKLPEGIYRIGLMAVSATGGTKLMNWSNRFLHIGQSGGNTERKKAK